MWSRGDHPSLCACVKFGYWELLLITGFLRTTAVNSTAERHKAKTVDVFKAQLFFEAELSPWALLVATKVQEPERKWVGEKSPKERSFLKTRATVQWTSWSSAGPHLAEQSIKREGSWDCFESSGYSHHTIFFPFFFFFLYYFMCYWLLHPFKSLYL